MSIAQEHVINCEVMQSVFEDQFLVRSYVRNLFFFLLPILFVICGRKTNKKKQCANKSTDIKGKNVNFNLPQ